jgi:hypothetical protein
MSFLNFSECIIKTKKISFYSAQQMFDDGINEVTMHLPKSVDELRRTNQSLSEADTPWSAALQATDDYDEKSSEVETPDEALPFIRDYSIDMWNGSPGLSHWGYKDGEK